MVGRTQSVGQDVHQISSKVFSKMADECAVPYPTSRGFQEWADVIG